MPRSTVFERVWTHAEDDQIRARFPDPKLVAALGRTWEAVRHRAARLGVRRVRGGRPKWTVREDVRLRDLWDAPVPLKSIARAIGRSEHAVYCRAETIKLRHGMPDGYELLTAACRRTGYASSQLRRILRFADITIYPVRRLDVGKLQHRHYVDPTDVDDAVAAWHATETVEAAARRVGLHSSTLRRLLDAVGALASGKVSARAHWRVPSAIIDQVSLQAHRVTTAELQARP